MKNKIILILFVLLCEAVGILGSVFTVNSIPTWYAQLNKPVFSPPNWVFGPVWTTLYAILGIVAYLIWKREIGHKNVGYAFKVFFVQLFLNAIWTPIFFGAKGIEVALLVIILLWLSIVYLMYLLKKIDVVASWLLVPYLLWVSFAIVLNYFLFILNK